MLGRSSFLDFSGPLILWRNTLPGQPRIEHVEPIVGFFAAVLRTVVHVRYLEVERDGVAIIAEAEMDQIARWVSEVDCAVVHELAVLVQGSEAAVLVEDVVMWQPTVYSLTRVVRILAALGGIARAELLDEHLMSRNHFRQSGLL